MLDINALPTDVTQLQRLLMEHHALVATQTFSTGHHLVVDVRTTALIVAIGMVFLRAPFLVVVASAAATAALLRLL